MAEIAIREERSVVEMLIDGKLFALYNFDPAAQAIHKPFFHPIVGPSGLPITQNGEYAGTLRGHYWHRGLMVAHQRVNGVSFWEERSDCGRILHESFEQVVGGSDQGGFVERLSWVSPDEKTPVREVRKVSLHCDQTGMRYLDLVITLTAAEGEVAFGQTSYGLMAAKASARLHVGDHDETQGAMMAQLVNLTGHQSGGQITFTDGEVNTRHTSQNGISHRARWGDYSGSASVNEGYAILDHPSNPRHPTPWLNWNNMTIGPSPTFEEPLVVRAGDAIRFVYRLVVHSGAAMSADIQEHWVRFAAQEIE